MNKELNRQDSERFGNWKSLESNWPDGMVAAGVTTGCSKMFGATEMEPSREIGRAIAKNGQHDLQRK